MLTSLTIWGRVTHICVGKRIGIGLDNGLVPARRQAIVWTNAGIPVIRPPGTNFSGLLFETHTFSFKNCIWKCPLENGGHFVWASMCYGIWEITMVCIYASYIGFNESNIFHVRQKSKKKLQIKNRNIRIITSLLFQRILKVEHNIT